MRPMIELLWASVEAAGYFVRSVKLKFPLFINVRKRYKTGADHSWGTKYFMSYAKKKKFTVHYKGRRYFTYQN